MRKPYAAIIAGLAVILMLASIAPSVLAGDGGGSPPVIYFVSPINRISGTYIYIYGAHFFTCFTIVPSSANGGYSGEVFLDLSVSVSVCSFGIADLNQRWEAGYYNGGGGPRIVDGYKFDGWSYIGLVGVGPNSGYWSDRLITFTGFENALPNYPLDLHIHNGDKILVAVFTLYGTAWAVTTYTGPSL